MATFFRIVEQTSRRIAPGIVAFKRLRPSLRRGLSRGVKKPSYWTIQVFPEGSGRAHNYRLRPRILHFSIVLLLGLVALSSAWVLGFLGQRHAISELDRYKAENQHLASNLDAMERQTERLTQCDMLRDRLRHPGQMPWLGDSGWR